MKVGTIQRAAILEIPKAIAMRLIAKMGVYYWSNFTSFKTTIISISMSIPTARIGMSVAAT